MIKIPEMYYVKVIKYDLYKCPFTYNIFLHKYLSLLLELENFFKKLNLNVQVKKGLGYFKNNIYKQHQQRSI